MRVINKFFSMLVLAIGVYAFIDSAVAAEPETLRAYIEDMKDAPRGPFSRLRWFCRDGTVLPPEPYACRSHGGGVQHGEHSAQARALHAAGYPVATLLADVTPADILEATGGDDLLKHLLLEQFLIGFDDGWVFRKARFYRGAVQHEDEERSGQALLEALAARDDWVHDRFLLLREAVRLLPHHHTLVSLGEIRGRAAAIADKDPAFRGLRGKIHGRPDAGDAQRVRDYASERGNAALAGDYEALAAAIDATYAANDLPDVLRAAAKAATDRALAGRLTALARSAPSGANERLALAGAAMAVLRTGVVSESDPAARVALLDASIDLERIAFVASRALPDAEALPRRDLLSRLRHNADALYGAGLMTLPEHREVLVTLEHLGSDPLELARYRKELRQLGMASEWAARQMRFHFGEAVEHLARIEPLAEQFLPDRLRGSALLAFEADHSALALDAQALGNVRHEVFGATVAAGVRSLNPGLARGVLYVADHDTPMSAYEAHGIYIVPETLPKLPPVAGILTRSEGNALSHVQLLARNLGIPNIVVSGAVLQDLEKHVGERIVIAASSGGVVRIAGDSFQWDNVFRAGAERERAPLRVDVAALDLTTTRPLSLSQLRADDSGRVAGPKAAKLGELMHRFPGHVAPGLVLPFGIYRTLLDQPLARNNELTMLRWIEHRYDELEALRARDTARYERELAETLEFVRNWILSAPLPAGFAETLRAAMEREFGPDGSYGVFVRSDTNVEDLPDFSGAGLNLTVPNVVGFEDTLAAIRRVWASPFTERAFAWRQSLMDQPEHVYASVLLQVGVPADKSGVLVSKDLHSGARDVATVVVNEGVGGGVNGQLAETLKIGLQDATVRRETTATATHRTVLVAGGGVRNEPVSARAIVLEPDEIAALRRLTRLLPTRLAEFAPRDGEPGPAADVEFGFKDGRLWLFQVRPLVENGAAHRNRYLNALDAGLRDTAQRLVDLDRRPRTVAS